MFSIFKKKKKKEGIPIYMSEPTILYNTKSEKACVEIIEENFSSSNIIVPSKYGLKPTEHLIEKAEIFVAVAILGKFTSLVVRELEIAQTLNKKIYTLEIARKGDKGLAYALVEGIPEEIEKLTPEQTNELYETFRREDFSGFMKLFLGERKSSW